MRAFFCRAARCNFNNIEYIENTANKIIPQYTSRNGLGNGVCILNFVSFREYIYNKIRFINNNTVCASNFYHSVNYNTSFENRFYIVLGLCILSDILHAILYHKEIFKSCSQNSRFIPRYKHFARSVKLL